MGVDIFFCNHDGNRFSIMSSKCTILIYDISIHFRLLYNSLNNPEPSQNNYAIDLPLSSNLTF